MASKYLKKFQVPDTFENILSDFAKEILRNQPKDIIDFGIEYFKGLEKNLPLDYKDKGENRPENYKRPENQEPNIINAPNNLEISQEDKGRLQRSMDKIERINKEPQYIPEEEKEKIIIQKKEEKHEKYEKEENIEEKNDYKYDNNENNVQVTKQVTVIKKETVIQNGEIIKNEEKIEKHTYEENNNINMPSLSQEKEEEKEIPQVFKKTEENQQKTEGRYNALDNELDEEHKKEYGSWFLRHSQNNEVLKSEERKEEPEPEVKRNEMGYDTWFNNNSEGSMVINKSKEVKQQQESSNNHYDEWFLRHSGNNLIIKAKPEDLITEEIKYPRYEGDYQTWFENHSKLSNK